MNVLPDHTKVTAPIARNLRYALATKGARVLSTVLPTPTERAGEALDVSTITRPHDRLLTYYLIVSLLTFLAFPVTFIPLFIKFRTLRYRFDDEGIWRRQGLLWRKEVNIAYRRIQDIHLTSNVIQRWVGLATVSVQTAAGSATPEVTIDGILEAEALRDFLYTKMRGVRDGAATVPESTHLPAATPGDESLQLLTEIRDALRRVEERLPSLPEGPQ